MKNRNGEEVSKRQMRMEQARLQAAKQGGEPEDFMGPSYQGNNSNGYAYGEHGAGKVIAEYIYLDKAGEPYLKVERTEYKQFPQYHWKPGIPGSKNGYWEPGAPSGPKIPYFLPDLIATPPDQPVFICEGEKDTEAVIDLELSATCCSEGTRRGVWTPELNEYFVGRKVVYILQDIDRAGWGHAQRVARNLVDVVDEVRIVKLPGLDLGQDVSDWLAAGGTKEALLKLAAASPKYRKRPTIKVAKGEISRIVDDVERALIKAKQPIFKRAGSLVTPIWEEMTASKGRTTQVTTFKSMSVANLIDMTNKNAAHFTRFDGRLKTDVVIDPPQDVMKTLLERGHWGFGRVTGIINAPTMRPDGSILDQPGYDAATQLWCWPDENLVLPKIPTKPTKVQATAALEKLKELLIEFPFVEGVDRSVALAAMLTTVLRGAFDVAPLFLFLAHTAGTGKSFLVDLITHIVNGRHCPVVTASRSREEMEKRIGAFLLKGTPMISLDNLNFDLEGEMLCQVTERPVVMTRVLGKSEMPEIEWRGVLFATANNKRAIGDMTRRTITCHLNARVEDPESRKFNFDPIQRVMVDRGGYLAAALTIARAYLKSDETVRCDPIASYGDWSRFAREPLIWLGETDPIDSMKKSRAHDPERNAARDLVGQWSLHLGTEKAYRVSEIIKSASEVAPAAQVGLGTPDWEHVRPEFHELLMTHVAKPNLKDVDPAKLGQWLGRIRGQVHNGWRIEAASESESHGNKWILVNAVASPEPRVEAEPKEQAQRTPRARRKT